MNPSLTPEIRQQKDPNETKLHLQLPTKESLSICHIPKIAKLNCNLTTQDNMLKVKYFQRHARFEDYSRVIQAMQKSFMWTKLVRDQSRSCRQNNLDSLHQRPKKFYTSLPATAQEWSPHPPPPEERGWKFSLENVLLVIWKGLYQAKYI